MAFGLQTSTDVDGCLALVENTPPFTGKLPAFASHSKTKIFRGKDLGDGEAIVDFGHIDLVGDHTCHAVGTIRCLLCGFQLGDGRSVVKCEVIGSRPRTTNPNRRIRE